jgi:hypothetical protein
MNIVINPNFYIEKLKHHLINEELKALRSALCSIENGTNHDLGSLSEHSPTNIAIFHEIGAEEAVQIELKKTYCAITRIFHDYIDELIAIQKFIAMPQKPNRTIHNNADLDKHIREQIAKKTQQLSKDGHLTGPKKLTKLGSLGKFLDKATTGYFSLRAAIEHHKSIAQKDIKVAYYGQEYMVEGKPMKLDKPTALRDTTIDLNVFEMSHYIKKGSDIKLTETDLEGIALTICFYIAPGIAKQAFE